MCLLDDGFCRHCSTNLACRSAQVDCIDWDRTDQLPGLVRSVHHTSVLLAALHGVLPSLGRTSLRPWSRRACRPTAVVSFSILPYCHDQINIPQHQRTQQEVPLQMHERQAGLDNMLVYCS